MWSCDRSFVTLVFLWSYHNLNFIRIWPENQTFWGVVLVQVQYFGTGTRYKFEILHQCGKRVKTESKKVFGASFYVCRSYRGKTSRRGGAFLIPYHPSFPSWIGLKQPIRIILKNILKILMVWSISKTTELLQKRLLWQNIHRWWFSNRYKNL